MFKSLFYLYLLGVFAVLAFANPTSEDIRKGLSSESDRKRFLALESLRKGEAEVDLFHQELITIALFEKASANKELAVRILFDIPPLDQEASNSKDTPVYDPRLSLLNEQISGAATEDQISALRKVRNMESIHPFIEYVLIKEFVFKFTLSRL